MQEGTPAARLCVLHVSPNAPPMDVYVDEVPLFTHLPYGQLSGCVTVPADRHRLRGFVAGKTDWECELLDAELEKLRDDEDCIVTLVERAQNLQVALLRDTAPGAEPRRAGVRVLHASPDAPALDVDVTGHRNLFRLVGLTEITPYREVDAGTYQLVFRRANHPEVIARLPDYALVSGGLHTYVVHGLVDGQPPLAVMPIVRTIERCVPER